MAKLPREPDLDVLKALQASTIPLEPDCLLFRIYRRAGPHPTRWNQFRYAGPFARFDHHLPEDPASHEKRGILYAATDLPTALAEFFQMPQRRIDRDENEPWLAAFQLASKVTLLDLTDTFAVQAGASMKLMCGPFGHAQAWSRGFYEAYPEIGGILYPSSMTNRPTVVFFERADSTALFPKSTRINRALADPVMLEPLEIAVQDIRFRLT